MFCMYCIFIRTYWQLDIIDAFLDELIEGGERLLLHGEGEGGQCLLLCVHADINPVKYNFIFVITLIPTLPSIILYLCSRCYQPCRVYFYICVHADTNPPCQKFYILNIWKCNFEPAHILLPGISPIWGLIIILVFLYFSIFYAIDDRYFFSVLNKPSFWLFDLLHFLFLFRERPRSVGRHEVALQPLQGHLLLEHQGWKFKTWFFFSFFVRVNVKTFMHFWNEKDKYFPPETHKFRF